MRVLIELFDTEPTKNLLAATIFAPEIVVFLCDERDTTLFKESSIYRYFRRRGLRTRPRFLYLNASDPEAVRRVLWAVLRDYPGCVFDFSGGRDLLVLVAGTFGAELDLPGFYIDLPRGNFVDIRHCAHLARSFQMPRFAAEDLFAMTGAAVHGHSHVAQDELTPDFERDAGAVFRIVQHNPKAWGEFVGYLQACCAGLPAAQLEAGGAKTMVGDQHPQRFNPVIFQRLHEAGVLNAFDVDGPAVRFAFKSQVLKRCLLINGIWLELFCYITAKNTHWFDEVRTGVVIDWDGAATNTDTAKNEVDVLLIKGVTPVFISCKMGLPSPLALSEIKLLSVKFGGRFSRSVLLCAGRLSEENRALQSRAEELGIHLLDSTALTGKHLAERLIQAAGQPPRSREPALPLQKRKKQS